MSGAESVLGNALISATGWALVHFIWQGCVIAGAYALLCAVSRRSSVHLRYWAGIAGLGLMAVTLAVTFAICFEPPARFVALPASADAVDPFLVLAGAWPDGWSLLREGIEPALPLVVLLWLLGFGVQTVKTGAEWLALRRLLRRASADVGTEILALAAAVRQRLGISRPVRILKSGAVLVPMAIGWLRPVVLLPIGALARLPIEQVEMVLAHEFGHIRRHDYFFNLFQVCLEALLYYHPAVRWMSRRIREERESCCDDLVVDCCGRPATYARALANLEAVRSPIAAGAMAATGGNLLARIRRIIDTELPRKASGYVRIPVLAVAVVIATVGTQQGLALSDALNRVAKSARLQSSDFEWKAWRESREAWVEGVQDFAALRQAARAPAVLPGPSAGQEALPALAGARAEVQPRPEPEPEPVILDSRKATTATALAALALPLRDSVPAMAGDPGPPPPVDRVASDPQPASPMALPGATVESMAEPSPVTPPPAARQLPEPLERVQPRYPWRARSRGIEGFVALSFRVDERGRPIEVVVEDAVPSGTFERAARKALAQWRFETEGDPAASGRLLQVFDFELDDVFRAAQRTYRTCGTTGRRACSMAPPDAIIVYINPPLKRRDALERHGPEAEHLDQTLREIR